MRFDHCGIGDSDEPYRGFEGLDADIAAAMEAFTRACPDLREIVLWGLCDAASAILFHAHRDPRVIGIVLLNPWVRTSEGEARAYLRHYYVQRLADPALWRRLVTGHLDLGGSARSLIGLVGRRFGLGDAARPQDGKSAHASKSLPDRMAAGLAKFKGPVLLIMSGQDLTAREFDDTARASKTWRRLLADPRVTRHDLPAADHTFSRAAWSDMVSRWTYDWIRSL
jgi:exosortase A-associated hydrolase 1